MTKTIVQGSKSRALLPGQSRSTKCSIRQCRRLDGHKGKCRTSLLRSGQPSVKQPVSRNTEGVEVLSFDRYTVQPEPKARQTKAAKRAPKGQCRVSRRDVRCSLRLGHKALGRRHRFGSPVRIVPEAKPVRIVAAGPKRARRSQYVVSGKPSARLA